MRFAENHYLLQYHQVIVYRKLRNERLFKQYRLFWQRFAENDVYLFVFLSYSKAAEEIDLTYEGIATKHNWGGEKLYHEKKLT